MPELQCVKCKEWKHKSEFQIASYNKTRGHHYSCRACEKIRKKQAYEKRKHNGICTFCGFKKEDDGYYICSGCRENKKEKNQQIKSEVFSAYGGPVCVCCGEKRVEFLTIDHINGGGFRHRQKGGGSSWWLKINQYPSGYQVLCMNCNFAKGVFGYCPHEWDKLYPMIYAEQDIDLTQWKEAVGL